MSAIIIALVPLSM